MAITASFNAAAGALSIVSDSLDNMVTVSRDAAGQILVNGGAVPILGGVPTVANTALIQAFGLGGADNLVLDESGGALPAANLFGGTGNDTAGGGSSDDQLFGQGDNDVLLGRGGFDQLFGGAGNDTLTGGDADDQLFGEGGDDRMIWNPGDDTDSFEGGAGIDTVEVNGGSGAERFAITANGQRVRFDRLDPAPFAIDIGTSEQLVLRANGGSDTISATGNLAALIKLTLDGGAGNDTILGGNGADVLIGGKGKDFVDGNQGDDVAFLGAGNDVFQWDPGDGSDVVEGQAGTDTMRFNGSNADENIDIAANGGRVLFFRNIANVTMDLDDVETIRFNALGGTDTITVNDLTGTDARLVAIDLAGVIGGAAGDGQPDTVIVNASNGEDVLTVSALGSKIAVDGLAARVTVDHAEASDNLVINGLAGEDIVDAGALAAGKATLHLLGGDGDDIIFGSVGGDTIDGGAGDDLLFGNGGSDTFRYSDPLDGHDLVVDFDGDAAGGQDVLDLDGLFDTLGVAEPDRAGRVSVTDGGSVVDISIDSDGNAANGFELKAVTLTTTDAVTVGQDVLLGS
jgi:Ca2+-binding RTX toxin-like protein